jgi:hypothetical protein
MGLFGAGDPPCPAGSICSGQAATDVGADKTKIYHASATSLSATGGASTTHVYIIKDGSWQKAATTTDGGKTYTYDDNVAGAALKQDLSNPQSAIHKNVDANVNKAADKAGVPQQEKDKLVDTNPNKANDEEVSGDTQPAAQPLSIPSTENSRNQFPNCVYPLDLGSTKQDVIKFTMLEYQPKDFNQSGQFGFSERDGSREGIGTVILPVPGGIQDSNSVEWSGQKMNAAEAALANIALLGITEGGSGFFSGVQQAADTVSAASGEVKTAIANAFAGAATGTGSQLLTRTTGAVINPNLELLFSGPSLRQFSFQFKLSAREAAESKEIVKIIRFFKQGSAAQKSTSQLFLKSPHTFRIQYIHRGPEGDENPFMNKIKECALQSVAVNYTPEGNYSTFSDGAMTSYELTLAFNELEPIFNNDYAQDNDATIGY